MKKVQKGMTRKAQKAYKNALVYMDLGNNYVLEYCHRGQDMAVILGKTQENANKTLLGLISAASRRCKRRK